jgi:hypothetical protein
MHLLCLIVYALITLVVMALVWVVVALILLSDGTVNFETVIIGSTIIALCTGAAMWIKDT